MKANQLMETLPEIDENRNDVSVTVLVLKVQTPGRR
jgi:hypothetical protein